jgi:hypothetical protein
VPRGFSPRLQPYADQCGRQALSAGESTLLIVAENGAALDRRCRSTESSSRRAPRRVHDGGLRAAKVIGNSQRPERAERSWPPAASNILWPGIGQNRVRPLARRPLNGADC